MKYTALIKHFRGFTFDREYESRESFDADMQEQHSGHDEYCWAHLFDKEGGQMVATYRRGYTMAEFL